jgi:hypothetical protein
VKDNSMRQYWMLAGSLSLLLLPTAAQAQSPQTPAVAKKDPNEIICERQKVPGSRLAVAKVCKTRAEWADLRNQDRMDLERAQTQRGTTR